MYEYVEKFNGLENSYCNLELPQKIIVEYMLDGLRRLDRKLLEASAGGNLMNLTPARVRQKIMEVAESERYQDESTKEDEYALTRNVSRVEPSVSAMAEQIRELKDMIQHVIRRQPVQTKPCGFCAATDHKIDECPTIIEDDQAEVNAVGDYQGYNNQAGPARLYGSSGNKQGANGPSWKNNSQNTHFQREPAQSLEDIVRELAASNQQLATSVHQFQAKTEGAIVDLSKQMSNFVQDMTELRKEPGRLPSQTEPNPKGNVSMVGVVDMTPKQSACWEDEMLDTMARYSTKESSPQPTGPAEAFTPMVLGREPAKALSPDALGTARPDPDTLRISRRDAPEISRPGPVLVAEKPETHNSSCAMQVVTPEGHMTEKDEPDTTLVVRPTQNDPIMRHPSAMSHESPEKSKDPGAFTVTCGIGETQIHHCLIDLGAAINVMPYSLYCSLGLGPLKPPRLSIELGDKSCVRPTGLLENLTLRVGDLVVPADFYVLQMGDSRDDKPPGLLLGRPFLHTTKTKIDMGMGLLSLTFGGKEADFYVYEDADRPCTRKPPDIVHTSNYDALVPDLPEQTIQTRGPAAIAKRSSPFQGYMKKSPTDQGRAEPNAPSYEHVGQIDGVAEGKYDLTRPWDPNL
ncbi:unnamed protein product [Rhodiola kirilowii]